MTSFTPTHLKKYLFRKHIFFSSETFSFSDFFHFNSTSQQANKFTVYIQSNVFKDHTKQIRKIRKKNIKFWTKKRKIPKKKNHDIIQNSSGTASYTLHENRSITRAEKKKMKELERLRRKRIIVLEI